jgi:CHAT domain-containing protein/tetratricopeptide (TPR) repeat protein
MIDALTESRMMPRSRFKLRSSVARRISVLLIGVLLLTVFAQRESFAAANSPFAIANLNQDGLAQLEPGKYFERKLEGGQSHFYEIRMAGAEFLRVVVDQRGIDIALNLFGPDGGQLSNVDDRHGERGPEAASVVASTPGVYRIEVRSIRKTDPSGSYQVGLERLQPATDENRAINAAEHLIAEANQLRAQSTKESLSRAIAKYNESLLLIERAGDQPIKSVVLNLIGRSYFALGEYQKALAYHQQALPVARAASDLQAEAGTLTYIGDGYRLTTENEKALEYLSQAIQGWQTIQDRRGEVGALNILARVYHQMGDQYKSISSFDRALHLARTLSDQSQEVETLGGMGLSYYSLGENEKAAELWKQELFLIRAGNQTGREANVLGSLGSAHNALGKYQEALDYLNQAIKLARDRGDRVDEAAVLQTIGRVYRSMGEPRKSIEYLEQSLVVLRGADNPPTSVARAHYNLGKAYIDLGEYDKAINYLNEALLVWRSRNDPINIASTIRELGRAERGRGNLETALAHSEVALNLIELLRTRAGGPEARAAYLASVQNYFELKIDVLTALHQKDPSRGYDAAALQTCERARARALLETLAGAGVDIRRGVAPELLKQERTLTDELSVKASERARLAGMKSVEASLAEVTRDLAELSNRYVKLEAQIRAASPRYVEMLEPQPLSLAQIREQVVDGQTVLLEYYLGEERSYLWAVTSTSIESFELPKRALVESAARRVYESLIARNRRVKFETADERRGRIAKADADYFAAARELSQTVLAPVAGQLANKRLLIVSDGALQYVPFAALPAPGSSSFEPLAVTNEIVSLPSASSLAVLRREVAKHKPAPKTIAVIADPVFSDDDPRLSKILARNKTSTSGTKSAARRAASSSRDEIQLSASDSGWGGEAPNLARLPFTRKEADTIVSLVPQVSRKEELDFAANLSNATSADLAQYRMIHFATHGFLNSRHPELSGIVLSLVDEKGQEQNGFLRAHEIYGLTLPADLVVLSGCRTGLGKDIRGEGVIGLTRAFMHAGAARVLVSLWDVSDEATAELITRFYRNLLGGEKHSPAAALRAAQTSMAQDKRWSAPYFWAGFTLQGEPR